MKKSAPYRALVTNEHIETVFNRVRAELSYRLNQKGYGSFISSHEAFGAMAEEWVEVENAVRAGPADFDKETLDLIVGCLFSLMSRESGGMEW